MNPYSFAGGTAVVTGAASGIGEALAHVLADRGSHLVLVDRDAERLAGVVGALRTGHRELTVSSYLVDLADAEATQRLADTLVAAHPDTTLLVNNAGVALGGRFDQVTVEEFEWVMAVNFGAPLRLTHTLLPVLRSHPGSHLVNISSLFGLIAPAGQTAYSASKFALRGLTESLRQELRPDGVGVTAVHPGGVRTRIAQQARIGSLVPPADAEQGSRDFDAFLRMDPAKAARLIVRAVERRSPRLLIGTDAKVPDLVARVLPGSYGRLLEAGSAWVSRRAAARRSAGAEPAGEVTAAGTA